MKIHCLKDKMLINLAIYFNSDANASIFTKGKFTKANEIYEN